MENNRTRFIATIESADRFTRNGQLTYAFYLIAGASGHTLWSDCRYVLLVTESQLASPAQQAIVALARQGQQLGFELENMQADDGIITFGSLVDVWGLPLKAEQGNTLVRLQK